MVLDRFAQLLLDQVNDKLSSFEIFVLVLRASRMRTAPPLQLTPIVCARAVFPVVQIDAAAL